MGFQSTLPRGERQINMSTLWKSTNFNPRSHEGSDREYCSNYNVTEISIHAPTRGATLQHSILLMDWKQFQSTLPRGERRNTSCDDIPEQGFQSTLPRGERLHGDKQFWKMAEISIHAPTRGATTKKPA